MSEYRALRERYSLLDICRTPDLATEVTLQPIRRVDLDAAILFSEFLRQTLGYFLGPHKLFFIHAQWHNPHWLAVAAIYGTTLFAVALPLKILRRSTSVSGVLKANRGSSKSQCG